MFSLRSLLLIGAIWLIIYLLQRARKARGAARTTDRLPEQMVRCKKCGIYLPVSEAAQTENGSYYCDEHRG